MLVRGLVQFGSGDVQVRRVVSPRSAGWRMATASRGRRSRSSARQLRFTRVKPNGGVTACRNSATAASSCPVATVPCREGSDGLAVASEVAAPSQYSTVSAMLAVLRVT
jgi:hypothetical protein